MYQSRRPSKPCAGLGGPVRCRFLLHLGRSMCQGVANQNCGCLRSWERGREASLLLSQSSRRGPIRRAQRRRRRLRRRPSLRDHHTGGNRRKTGLGPREARPSSASSEPHPSPWRPCGPGRESCSSRVEAVRCGRVAGGPAGVGGREAQRRLMGERHVRKAQGARKRQGGGGQAEVRLRPCGQRSGPRGEQL